MQHKNIFLIMCCMVWICWKYCWGQENKNFDYNIDISFTYVDVIKNFDDYFGNINNNWMLLKLSPEDNPTNGSRTLGLSKFKVLLHWQVSSMVEFNSVLRPDAFLKRTNTDDYVREFDSRSGNVYKPSPEVMFLDSYYLTIKGSSLKFAVGVWENLVQRKLSYEPVLEFGLLVQFPQKFAALKFSWTHSDDFVPYPQAQKFSNHLVEVWGFGGNGDRAEKFDYKTGTYDLAPSAKDSRYGMGIYYEYNYFQEGSISVFGGIDSTNSVLINTQTPDNSKEVVSSGVHHEYFYQLGGNYFFKHIKFPTLISTDIRYSTENWRFKYGYNVKGRFHQSGSLSLKTQVIPSLFLLLGYHAGKSKFAEDELHQGYQLDFGILNIISKELVLCMFISQEYRAKFVEGEVVGAFSDNDSQNHTYNLKRFALNINYSI